MSSLRDHKIHLYFVNYSYYQIVTRVCTIYFRMQIFCVHRRDCLRDISVIVKELDGVLVCILCFSIFWPLSNTILHLFFQHSFAQKTKIKRIMSYFLFPKIIFVRKCQPICLNGVKRKLEKVLYLFSNSVL